MFRKICWRCRAEFHSRYRRRCSTGLCRPCYDKYNRNRNRIARQQKVTPAEYMAIEVLRIHKYLLGPTPVASSLSGNTFLLI